MRSSKEDRLDYVPTSKRQSDWVWIGFGLDLDWVWIGSDSYLVLFLKVLSPGVGPIFMPSFGAKMTTKGRLYETKKKLLTNALD